MSLQYLVTHLTEDILCMDLLMWACVKAPLILRKIIAQAYLTYKTHITIPTATGELG